jgi:hypothetical protein
MNLDIIEAVRANYQFKMKSSVAKIKILLSNNNDLDILEKIDNEVGVFTEAKEKATYFEAIITSLSKTEGVEK